MRVLGIDLGHCETAGAVSKDAQGHCGVSHVDASNNHDKVIVTQIVLTNDQMRRLKGKKSPSKAELDSLGTIAIGNDLPDTVTDGEKFIYFKVPPKSFDEVCAVTQTGKECGITHGMVMACFAYALVKNIFMCDPEMAGEKISDAVLLVGCPTTEDWTSAEAKRKYAELIKKAAGVQEVEIVPESRAAMFSSVEYAGQRISVVKGALVFDFGSSTADCTYMMLGRKMIEFSWALGASAIDRTMVEAAFDEAQQTRSFQPEISSFIRCENDMRKVKEGYYSGQYGSEGHDMVCVFREVGQQKPVKQAVTVDDAMMDYVTKRKEINVLCNSNQMRQGTWYELCREFLEEARATLERAGLSVGTIVLTGGASKMGFIYELCCEVFKGMMPKENILVERNPSYTVANGLVWAANADKKVQECMQNAKSEIDQSSTCKIDVLKSLIRDAVFNELKAVVEEQSTKWAQLSDTHSIDELSGMMKARAESEEIQGRLNVAIGKSIETWKKSLSEAIGTAVNNQAKQLYSDTISEAFILPKDVWAELNERSFNAEGLNTGAVLDKTTVSLLLNGAVLFIISCLLYILLPNALQNKAQRWMEKKEREKQRSQADRVKFAEKMKKRFSNIGAKDEILGDVAPKIDEYAEKYGAVIDSMLERAFEIVTLKRFDADDETRR